MQKVLQSMPNGENIKAETVLEINENHPIAKKLKELYEKKDKEKTSRIHQSTLCSS